MLDYTLTKVYQAMNDLEDRLQHLMRYEYYIMKQYPEIHVEVSVNINREQGDLYERCEDSNRECEQRVEEEV